ncbi:MAG: hypothetical protein MUF77_14185 [Leptospira sp.]|jgi:hypothetical protein|nr:hypothetical protein [Leptospira sp.]
MEESLRDLIQGYKVGFEMYEKSLPKNNPVLVELYDLFKSIETLAIESRDYMVFMEEATKKDYFNQIISFHSKLSAEMVNLPSRKTIPSPKEMAVAYHNAYDSLPKEAHLDPTRKVYERIFELEANSKSGPEFLYRLEFENLLTKLTSVHWNSIAGKAQEDLKTLGRTSNTDSGIVSLPATEEYFEKIKQVSEQSKSVLGLEVAYQKLAEENILDTLKDTVNLNTFFHSLIYPIVSYRLVKSKENQLKVKSAYAHWKAFWNKEFDELFENPRIQDYFSKTIYGASKESLAEQGIPSEDAFRLELKNLLNSALNS